MADGDSRMRMKDLTTPPLHDFSLRTAISGWRSFAERLTSPEARDRGERDVPGDDLVPSLVKHATLTGRQGKGCRAAGAVPREGCRRQ